MSSLSPIPSSPPPAEPKIPQKASQANEKAISGLGANPEKSSTSETPLHLSSESQNMKTYNRHMQELPDVRQDRINELQQAIEEGTYSVPAEKLADKLIQEL